MKKSGIFVFVAILMIVSFLMGIKVHEQWQIIQSEKYSVWNDNRDSTGPMNQVYRDFVNAIRNKDASVIYESLSNAEKEKVNIEFIENRLNELNIKSAEMIRISAVEDEFYDVFLKSYYKDGLGFIEIEIRKENEDLYVRSLPSIFL